MAVEPNREVSLADLPNLEPTLGSLDFVQDREIYKTIKPYQVNGLLPPDQEEYRTNLLFETRDNIPIYDLRPHLSILDLETHGFEFKKCPELAQIDVSSETGVEMYLQEVVKYLKAQLGAEQVVVYAFNVSRIVIQKR
jgi:hypothetical protein